MLTESIPSSRAMLSELEKTIELSIRIRKKIYGQYGAEALSPFMGHGMPLIHSCYGTIVSGIHFCR